MEKVNKRWFSKLLYFDRILIRLIRIWQKNSLIIWNVRWLFVLGIPECPLAMQFSFRFNHHGLEIQTYRIRISYCKLWKVSWNYWFLFQESLEEINLEGNKISSIAAGTFVDLPNLKRVNLQENKLKTVARNSLQLFKTVGKFI